MLAALFWSLTLADVRMTVRRIEHDRCERVRAVIGDDLFALHDGAVSGFSPWCSFK